MSIVDPNNRNCPDNSNNGPDSSNRWGNKKVTITDVDLLDKFGIRCKRFNSMDPMTIKINYHAVEDLSDITFGIAIHAD